MQPALPPYNHLSYEDTVCIAKHANQYQVPELLLHSILVKENGRKGKCSKNKDGTEDCGLSQINTKWIQDFYKRYKVTKDQIKNDNCLNIQASAYVLRTYYNMKQDWFYATVAYNIGPYNWNKRPKGFKIGDTYARSVFSYWNYFNDYVQKRNALIAKHGYVTYAQAK